MFDIDRVLKDVEAAVRPFPKAGLFELAEEGYGSPFELLVACIISIRTLDEVMMPCSRHLFARARTPLEMCALRLEEIDAAIGSCTFHERKAGQILAIAQQIVADYGGELPCELDVLLAFKGVGPKCANLVLGINGDPPSIGVDVHVFRITNRWGYVEEKTPEKTMRALEEKLPRRHWVDINRLLVPFGKHVCTGNAPVCSGCPIADVCAQVGVDRSR